MYQPSLYTTSWTVPLLSLVFWITTIIYLNKMVWHFNFDLYFTSDWLCSTFFMNRVTICRVSFRNQLFRLLLILKLSNLSLCYWILNLKFSGAGEMTQQVKILFCFFRGAEFGLKLSQGSSSLFNSSSRGSNASFWPPWELYKYGVQTHMQSKHTCT